MSKRSLLCQSRLCGRQLCQIAIIPLFWLTRIRFHCFCLLFGLLDVYWRNRLLPDRRSRFTNRLISLWLALRWIFPRFRSRMLGLRTFVLGNRFCPGFRFRLRFRQLVDSFFCQMTGFPHGMVGGIRDLAALVAIFRLTVLCCFAQLLPKLLKGASAPRRNAACGADLNVSAARSFSGDFSLTSRITTPAPLVQTSSSSSAGTACRFSGNDPRKARWCCHT